MNRASGCWRFAVTCWVALCAGCMTPCTVTTGARTPASFGEIKLYGTANVPFEYEEIGIHSLMVDTGDQQAALRAYADQVRTLGADAVLNFSMKPVTVLVAVFGFTMGLDTTQYELTGVAVKIKRP